MTRRIMQIGYAMHSSRSRDAVIPVYDDAGNVIETHVGSTAAFFSCCLLAFGPRVGVNPGRTDRGVHRLWDLLPA